MKKRIMSLTLAGTMALSVLWGGSVPVFGQEAVPCTETEIITEERADQAATDEIDGEYAEGEIIVCCRPEAFAAGELHPDSDPVLDMMEQAEDLMDVSRGAAALKAEEEGPDAAVPDALESSAEGTVLKLVRSDRYSTKELLKMYADVPGVLFAEPNSISRIEEEAGGETADGISIAEVPAVKVVSQQETGEGTADDVSIAELPATELYPLSEADEAAETYPDLAMYQYAYGNGAGGINVPDWNDPENTNAVGVVAVVDTGVDHEHPDLKSVMWDEGEKYPELVAMGGGKYGFNAAYELNGRASDDTMDFHHHGTHCAGIIAAAWDGSGISGAANGARIMALKNASDDGQVYVSSSLKAFNYIRKAKELKVNVIAVNNSWTFDGDTSLAIAYAARELSTYGIVSCYASGNDSKNTDIHVHTSSVLSGIPGVIVVNAQTEEGERTDFSDYGIRTTHIFSPGMKILSTYPRDQAKVFPTIPASEPAIDTAGSRMVNDYGKGEAYFSVQANTLNGVTAVVDPVSGALVLSGAKPAIPEQRDEITRETVKPYPSLDSRHVATLATLKAKAPLSVSAGDTATLLFNIRMDKKGVDNDEMIGAFIKSTKGYWILPNGKLHYLEQANNSCSYALTVSTAGTSFDLDDLEIRLVLLSSGEITGDIFLQDIWVTAAKRIPYEYSNGTSMAAPAAAGAVAILAKTYPNDTADMRAARLLAGAKRADDYGDECITGGMVNVGNSLDESTYTPVISGVELQEDGLHLPGFFYGEHAPEVILKQGDLTFSTSDGSLSVRKCARTPDGEYDLVLSVPQGLRAGELTSTLINKDAAAGRTDFSRVLTLDDPEGLLMPFYTQLAGTESLNGLKPTSIVAVEGSLIVSGEGEESIESWICSPAGLGTWEKLPTVIYCSNYSNVIAWNKMLIYVDTDGVLCLYDPKSGSIDKGNLSLGDDRNAEDGDCVFYYDGENVILLWTPFSDEKEATQVYRVMPDLFIAGHIGDLKGSYGGVQTPVVAHDPEAGQETVRYYVYGRDELSGDTVPGLESFTLDPFASTKISLVYPADGDMVFSQVYANQDTCLFSGCALKDGMMISGILRFEDAGADNPVLLNDNFFISFRDPEHKAVPSSRRMAPTMIFGNKICAYKGKVYMIGLQSGNSLYPALSVASADTLPAYGDVAVRPSDPSTGTDTSVKLKKLALSPNKLTMTAGETAKLTAAPSYRETGASAAIAYGTSNREVAVVSADGTVYARNAGSAVITAYCGDKRAVCRVTVEAKADPELNMTATALKTGEMELLILKNAFVTGRERITWKSTDKKVVSVSNGLLTAKKAGTADVKATWKSGKNKQEFTCHVEVTDISVPKAAKDDKAVKLSVSKSSLKLDRTKSAELTVKLQGEEYKNRCVTFTSLNPDVADFGEAGDIVTVSGGDVKAGASSSTGEVTVSVTGQSAGTTLVVVEARDPSGATVPVNRKLVKIKVSAPAESILFTGTNVAGSQIGTEPVTLTMKTGSTLAVGYELSPEVCTNASRVKWKASKGGVVTVKNGVITAKKASSSPATVTATCGDQKLEIKVIVKD